MSVVWRAHCGNLCDGAGGGRNRCQGAVHHKHVLLFLRDECITDDNGQFIIEKIESGKYSVEISFLGYADYRQELVLDQSLDLGEIILAENNMILNEVVVAASMVKRFADKKEYKLTNIEKKQYSSALLALEHLPKIQVIDHNVNSVDGKAVKILINGHTKS